jgi:hypothetical protein
MTGPPRAKAATRTSMPAPSRSALAARRWAYRVAAECITDAYGKLPPGYALRADHDPCLVELERIRIALLDAGAVVDDEGVP